MRIGIVAPSTPIGADVVEAVDRIAAERFPGVRLDWHPQCFRSHGHFAGTDAERAAAFVEVANDPDVDALWFARGGYGSCRIVEDVLPQLDGSARDKIYLGYSDAGFMLAGLYGLGFSSLAHGPMPADVRREGGAAAVQRALAWLAEETVDSLEPAVSGAGPAAAFNITVLSQMLGTPLQPDLAGHVLMLEEVSEHSYRTDRALFHITSNPAMQRLAGSASADAAKYRRTILLSDLAKRMWYDIGASVPVSLIWAVPISAMTPTTRWCRSELGSPVDHCAADTFRRRERA
jgi:muramoyltetrapeptide carboxypeptidase